MTEIAQTKETAEVKKMLSAKEYLSTDLIKQKFTEILGKKATGFIASVLQVVSSNKNLQNADPVSIFNAAAVAATLDLPINNNLGFAYIIPYNESVKEIKSDSKTGKETVFWKKKQVAQFQISAKGFIQLAQRSGQFQTINATDVREGEMKANNRLSGEMQFEWIQNETERLAKPIIGYISYFKLLNGFEKPFYMSIEKLKAHGAKHSKTFNNSDGKWATDLEAMCLKTVTKLNLSKNAPLSIEMLTAIKTDQAVLNDEKGNDVKYVDNIEDAIEIDKEEERVDLMLKDCKTLDELDLLQTSHPDINIELFNNRKLELQNQ